MCSIVHYLTKEKNEDLEGNHCVIVFAAADLLRPLAAKLWFSLLGDTGLLTKVTKSHNKHKNKAIGEIAAPNYTFAVILQMNRPLSFE